VCMKLIMIIVYKYCSVREPEQEQLNYREEQSLGNHIGRTERDSKPISLKDWLEEYDVLLEDLSTDKKLLHEKILEAQRKVNRSE
jgi:hypothetical protein